MSTRWSVIPTLLLTAALAGTARGGDTVAYLGVATQPVDPALAHQLNLPEGVGLTVVEVAEGSPAAGQIERHDVLHKFADQILANPEQLAVLVRSRHTGDEVILTVLRKGEERTVTVKLGEIERSRLSAWTEPGPHMGLQGGRYMHDMQQMEDMLRHMEKGMRSGGATSPNWWGDAEEDEETEPEANPAPEAEGKAKAEIRLEDQGGAPGSRTQTFTQSTVSSVVSETRDGRTLTVTGKDGRYTAKATDGSGQVLFEGPVDTKDQIKAAPEDLRGWIKDLKGRTHIDVRPGGAAALPKNAI
jgi:hypothetical protein